MTNPPVETRTALVLMKFEGDSWNDRTYSAIRDVLNERGFDSIRADEIRTSGPVVEEICERIRNTDLIVIDTSGDSHSVSYELGFAHGVQRGHNEIIVLRSKKCGPIPFNFAHIRTHLYNDRRHLKVLLRKRLDISQPLRGDQLGYALTFSIRADTKCYGETIACSVLDALKTKKFSGRCECYSGSYDNGTEKLYIVALGLQQDNGKKLSYAWYKHLSELVGELTFPQGIVVDYERCELGEIDGIRQDYLSSGNIEINEGVVVSLIGLNNGDTWFMTEARRRIVR